MFEKNASFPIEIRAAIKQFPSLITKYIFVYTVDVYFQGAGAGKYKI